MPYAFLFFHRSLFISAVWIITPKMTKRIKRRVSVSCLNSTVCTMSEAPLKDEIMINPQSNIRNNKTAPTTPPIT